MSRRIFAILVMVLFVGGGLAMAQSSPVPARSTGMAPATAAATTVDATKTGATTTKPEKKADTAAPAKSEKGTKAETKPASKGGAWGKADLWIGRISGLLVSLLSLVMMILGWFGKKQWTRSARLKKILGYADVAFDAIEGFAKTTKWKGDDKLAEFLKAVSDIIRAEGDKPLDGTETELLKKYATLRAAKDKAKKKTK